MSVFVSPEYFKAKVYANNRYATAVSDIVSQTQDDLKRARTRAAVRAGLGAIADRFIANTVAKIYAKQVQDMMQAMLSALLDGYELYGVEITDEIRNEIITVVIGVRANAVENLKRTGFMIFPEQPRYLEQSLESIGVPTGKIFCQIEERRVKMKREKEKQGDTNVNVRGDNARVNVGGIDQSVNVVTTSKK